MYRFFIIVLALVGLAACAVPDPDLPPSRAAKPAVTEPTDISFYASRTDGSRTLAPVDVTLFDPGLLRQRVTYETEHPAGTIVVDTANYHLYLVEGDGRALRYGVAIGRSGMAWTGEGHIARRAAWPTWTPPPEMIARDPVLARHANGMRGGPHNPLGARALYIYQGDRDTMIRVHGTNAPPSIGTASSSGCFRMLNQDVVDLFSRVPVGARIIVN